VWSPVSSAPNGSGKSTTMHMIMGLDYPDSGAALIGGRPYSELAWPLREVGGLLDAKAFHPARTARNHLRWLALTNDVPLRRVDEVGLSSVANRRVVKFSLGMSQRLGIAATILGHPGVLLFDEPVNGLDPEGIRWVRHFLRGGPDRFRFQPSDQRDVPDRRPAGCDRAGRLVAETSVADFVARSGGGAVRLVAPDVVAFTLVLTAIGAKASDGDAGSLPVEGLTAPQIGDLAVRDGLRGTWAPRQACWVLR
jgi:ABC-2 type transport system ATP-binding protein